MLKILVLNALLVACLINVFGAPLLHLGVENDINNYIVDIIQDGQGSSG